MNKRGNGFAVLGIILLILAIGIVGFFAGRYTGLWDINGPVTHTYNVSNHSVSITMPFVGLSYTGGWNKYVGHYRCEQTINDASSNRSIDVNGYTYNDNTICSFGMGVSTKTDIDLSQYRRVTIKRSLRGSAQGIGAGSAGISGTILGKDARIGLSVGSGNNGSMNWPVIDTTAGDVFITNNNGVCTVQSGSYAETFDCTKSLYYADSFGVSGSGGAGFGYIITSIEATPLPIAQKEQPSPITVCNGNCGQQPPADVTSSHWYDSILAWLRSLFTF